MQTNQAQTVFFVMCGCRRWLGGVQMINDRTSYCFRIQKTLYLYRISGVYSLSVLCTHPIRWHAHTHTLRMLGATARTAAALHRVLDALDVARVRATAAANHFGAQLDPLGHVAFERYTVLLARPARLHAVHLAAVRIDDQRQLLGGRSAAVQRFEQGRDVLRSKFYISCIPSSICV